MDATEFLKSPEFIMDDPTESFVYQITYSDGSEFELTVGSIEELKALHAQITTLANHMNGL
jgi:hypothetical protein